MTFNIPSETIPGNGTSTPASKRKSSRKSAASGPASERSTSKRFRTAGSVEILFKEPPNPHQAPKPPYIWIDYPQQNERLRAPVYVIRLGAGGAETVEISFNGEPWKPCRLTSGYWWYDWSAIAPGKHALTARMKATDGQWFKTPPRLCEFRP